MSEHDHVKKQSWFTDKAPSQREPMENLFGDAHVGSRTRTQDMVNPNVPVAESAFVKLARAKKAEQQESAGGSALEHVQRAATDSGSPLPDEVRGKFEASLGTDLSGVRVHTGAASTTAAESVGAKAYTTGQDIHFGAAHYDPSSKEGQRLLGHEVAHTVQQGGAGPAQPQAKLEVSEPADAHEQEADSAADAMIVGRPVVVSRSVGALVQRKTAAEDMDAAAQSVKVPLPKVPEGKGVPVTTDHAPTVDDVFDPQRPALDGASQGTLLTIIQQYVNDLYTGLFKPELDRLQAQLSKAAPVPDTPFALKLLGWVVEQIASVAIAYVGGFIGKELFGHKAPQETVVSIGGTESEPAIIETKKPAAAPEADPRQAKIEKASEDAGEQAGSALKDKMLERPTTAPAAEETPQRMTTGELLNEFIAREQQLLLARKNDITARLMLMQEHAAGAARPDTLKLAEQLRDLIGAPALVTWFRNKVTMEWLNFVARVSLGPRVDGQTTDLIGANMIDGIAGGDIAARKQWVGAAGMVEITLNVPDSVTGTKGLALQRASIPSSFGGTEILQQLQGYTLATMPVYRRIWLKTGESKLSEAPAFVITPEGNVEADFNNPVLAAIGNGKPTHVGESTYTPGSNRFTDEERKDPNAWSRRAIASAHCISGAHAIRDMLSGISPKVLK